MNSITAKNAMVFLSRVDLKGAETQAFQEVVQAIAKFIEEPTDSPVEDADSKEKSDSKDK